MRNLKRTDSFYLALSEEHLEAIILLENESSGMRCVREIAQIISLTAQETIYFKEYAATHTRNTIRGNQVSLGRI